jgi:predicted phosphoadenosine phosphosulfate sulfurtransferase
MTGAPPGGEHSLSNRTRERKFVDTDVYTLACERMEYIYDNFDTVIVSFSGGKDSTAVLNVALDVAHSDPRFERHLPLRVAFYDEEAVPYETEEYVRRVYQRPDVNMSWFCIPVQHRNACSRTHPYWWPWAPESEDLWCRPMPAEATTTLKGFRTFPAEARLTIPNANGLLAPPELGNTALVMGIRGQESMTRMRAVMTQSKVTGLNYINKFNDGTSRGNLFKAYPVYDWTAQDVWTAPAKLGWDYNRSYDRMEMHGIGHASQRCSPPFGEEPIQKLHMFAACFPEVWDKMVERVPGAGAAARYATTELYAFRDRPVKPPGMAWPEFIAHYLAKHRAKECLMIKDKLEKCVRRHYRVTSDPILPTAHHPRTGVCWSWILLVAMRGDFKGRRIAIYNVGVDEFKRPLAREWQRYAIELDEVLAAGTQGELGHPGRFPASGWDLLPDYAQREGS